jgi:hypothetical protein
MVERQLDLWEQTIPQLERKRWMCRGQGRYDVVLGISDGAFGSNSAMVLCRGIFDGDV